MPGENGMGIDPSEKDPRGLLGYAREFVRQHPNSILGAFLSIVLFSLGVFFEALKRPGREAGTFGPNR